jgi:hypothetical protein
MWRSEMTSMFGIEWLRNGVLVDKDSTVLADEAEAVADARSRAAEIVARHPEHRPDSFRLTDASGKVFGVFPIYARGDDVH